MPLLDTLKRLGSKKEPGSRSPPASPLRRPSAVDEGPRRTMPTRRPAAREPPPPYTAAPASTTSPASPTTADAQVNPATNARADNQYAFLAQFDTVFLIDDSGSMAGRSWRETSEALAAIAPVCTEQDADGIDIYFLNHRRRGSNLGAYNNVKTTAEVREIFSVANPSGGTPTGTRLNHILKPYLAQVEEAMNRAKQGLDNTLKPLNVIVITDGEPTDDVTSVIVQAAKKLDKFDADPWQIGIQFFQVGQEPGAAECLRELDDELSEEFNIRDMVDTVPWSEGNGALTADFLMKVVLGSINRKLDRRRTSRS